MSLYFVINNLHFALETFGALAFLMVSWLAFDALAVRRDFLTASRAVGFLFLAVWQVLHAFQFADENLQYLGYLFYFLGLLFVTLNLLLEFPVKRPDFKLILLPISTFVFTFDSVATVLLFAIAGISFRQYLNEQKVAIRPFAFGFVALAIGSLISLFYDHDTLNMLWGFQHLFEFAGYCFIILWVWQYLQLRIREELLMIFFSVALFVSTVATLAFSMINAIRVESLTAANLSTNAKLFDLSISNLKDNVLSKVLLLAKNENISKDNADGIASSMSLRSLKIVDRTGVSVVNAFSGSVGVDLSKDGAIGQAIGGKPVVTMSSTPDEGFLIKSAAPIFTNGKITGAVVAGFPLDTAFLDNVNRMTGLQLSVYYGNSVVASTAFGDLTANRIGTKEINQEVLDQVLAGGKPVTVQTYIYSRPYLASYVPVTDYQGKVIGMISVAESNHDILDVSNQTNRLTLIAMLIIMLILSAPFYRLTKRLSEESH